MDSGSIFSLLTGGVKFDKKTFSKDIPGITQSTFGAAPSTADTHAVYIASARKRKRDDKFTAAGPGIKLFASSGAASYSDDEEEDEEEEVEDAELGSDDEEGSEEASEDEDEDADEGEEDEEEEEGAAAARRRSGARFGTSQGGAAADGNGLADPGCPVVHTGDIMEAANVVRKHYRIKVQGTDIPAPLRSWRELGARFRSLAPRALGRVLDALAANTYGEPTPIQRQAIPCLLAGRELLAVAPTGSGKTLAFLLPLVLRLCAWKREEESWGPGVKAVVLSPTHELAGQQARVLKLLLPGTGLRASLLAKSTAAGTDFSKVDILLANPLRLSAMAGEDAEGGRKVDLSAARFLVLDEADKLFEMGFMEQIDGVIAACSHKEVVRALFSATLPDKVEALARSVLVQPLRVTVGARNTAVSSVSQRLLFVGRENGKLLALRQLLAQGLKPPVLVFVASKDRAKALHRELLYDGVHVDSLNAGQSTAARAAAVDNFRSGKTWVLIATDLIGRGMDFPGVATVVNFDFPNSTTDYIHRIGRTGRAGAHGEAITLFTEDDKPLLRPVAALIKEAGGEVPDWMMGLKKVRTRDRKRPKLPAGMVKGDTISTVPRYDREKAARRKQAIEASKARKAAAAAGKGAGDASAGPASGKKAVVHGAASGDRNVQRLQASAGKQQAGNGVEKGGSGVAQQKGKGPAPKKARKAT